MKIYHNPKCSKSRASLELLQEAKEDFEIVNYIEKPLSFEELKNLLRKLALPPRAILRTSENVFSENYSLDSFDLDDPNAVLEAIARFPILLERPIVEKGDKAVIGRPPENLKQLWS